MQEQYKLDYQIRRGATDGEVITFSRAGEQRPGRIPGDVNLKLNIGRSATIQVATGTRGREEAKITRRGRDLHTEVRVTLKESLLGFTTTITHLDRHTLKLERSAVTPPGTVLRIAGEGLVTADADGMVDQQKTGDLLVTVWVDFPRTLSDEAEQWARAVLP